MDLPYSPRTSATYENFDAECPQCHTMNVFNRATDLHTFEPIGFRSVACQKCEGSFSINNDSANAAHEMLLFDCFDFIKQRRYIHCVLTVAQAYEVFFSHFLRVQLIYRPYARERSHDLAQLNRILNSLYERTEWLTFEPMRRLVLRTFADKQAPKTLAEGEEIVARLSRNPKEVTHEHLQSVPDAVLRDLLVRLAATKVHALRNRVIHKQAYRPTLAEAKAAHEEASDILHGLTGRLGMLGDEINWYLLGEGGIHESESVQ